MSSSDGKNDQGSSQDSQSEPNFEWELCRENIRPLKSGRRVADINRALATTAIAPKPAIIIKEKFDETIELYETHSDPLIACLGFIRWFEASFPSGRQRLFYEYTWKIVHRLVKEERYKEDERMLKVWGRLADNSLGNGWNIFQYANTIGSLVRSAKFYVQWAKEFEFAGSVAEARKVFARARKMCATPIDLLNSEEDLLEMREMRRVTDSKANDSWNEEDEDELDENGQRVAFTRLRGLGPSMVAPVVRLSDERENFVKPQSSKDQRAATANNDACGFSVYEEGAEDDGRSQLEMVYEMDTHIEHIQLTENAGRIEKMNPGKTIVPQPAVHCGFSVWEEGEDEHSAPKQINMKKPRLMVKKLLREMSFEEGMAEYYEALMTGENSCLEPKRLVLSKRDIKPTVTEEEE